MIKLLFTLTLLLIGLIWMKIDLRKKDEQHKGGDAHENNTSSGCIFIYPQQAQITKTVEKQKPKETSNKQERDIITAYKRWKESITEYDKIRTLINT